MSHSYTPELSQITDPLLREEFARLQEALNSAQMGFTFQVLHAEPARVWAGLVIYADGTDFDPGSGEGLYRRNAANAAWVFIG